MDLSQIANIIPLIDTVKHRSTHIELFKELVEENLDEPLEELLQKYSKDEVQTMLYQAQKATKLELEKLVGLDDYLLELPDTKPYLANVKTLNDLENALKAYIEALPHQLVKVVSKHNHYDLGSGKYYNELPLNEAGVFIEVFHRILSQPEEYNYIVAPYDLNYELKIAFETQEEAIDFASMIAPAVVWKWNPETEKLEEICCL
jgi:hypothetical protein